MESATFLRLEAAAPWLLNEQPSEYGRFGMVSQGGSSLAFDGDAGPVTLSRGDCFLIAPGSGFTLSDAPESRDTTIPGGQFTLGEPDTRLWLDLLPRLVLIRASAAHTPTLQSTLKLLESETAAAQPGSQLVINRLMDVFFAHAVRAYLNEEEFHEPGRLRAMADPQIGAALKAMHDRIEDPWTVIALALVAGMSRSAFAPRFKELVGETPVEYLTRWRMYKAARLLREHHRKVFEIAISVGYDSDGAFNKAFKRVLGVPPGEYRRRAIQRPGLVSRRKTAELAAV